MVTVSFSVEQGRLAELTGDADTAAARYRQAYALYPHPEVDAGAALRCLGLAPDEAILYRSELRQR